MIDSKLRARLSRHSTLRRLAAGEPLSVHPDYQPTGIAPRIGHALKLLSEDPQASSTVQGLATAIRHNGDHSILPQLSDALEEEGHPAFGQFDWKHAPRAIEIDKALETEIGRHRIRQINPDTGRRENRPLSPGWVLADWKEKTRGRVPLRRAVEIVRQRVPDATRADVVHSAIRLESIHNHVRPAHADVVAFHARPEIAGANMLQMTPGQAHQAMRVHGELDRALDQQSVYRHGRPESTSANLKMLGVPDADPHKYPDTRLSRRRLSRFRDAVRRLALPRTEETYRVVPEDQPTATRSMPSATRVGKLPVPTARRVDPYARRVPYASRVSPALPKGKIIPTAKAIADPKKATLVHVPYHVTYRHKDGGTKSKVVFASHGPEAVRLATKVAGHFPLTVREATGEELQKNPGASTRVKFAKYQGETPERMALGNPDHEAFLQKIAQNPEDDHSSLVFADWLEENGHENSAKVIRGQHSIEGHAKPITWRSTNFPHIADRPFQLHAMVENPYAEDGEGSPLADVDLYFGHEHPIGNQNKMYGWTYSIPHKDVPDLMRGLADEGVHGAEEEWNHMEGLNETPERESRDESPVRKGADINRMNGWIAPSGEFHPIDTTHEAKAAEHGFGDIKDAMQAGWQRVAAQYWDRKLFSNNRFVPPNDSQVETLRDLAARNKFSTVVHDNDRRERVLWDSSDQLSREGQGETPERESAYRTPAGGAIVRGIYYKGGKMMPDLQKFARAFGAKRLSLMGSGHDDFTRNIAKVRDENEVGHNDGLPAQVYADFVEEEGKPVMAAFIRDAARRHAGPGQQYRGDATAIMHYKHTLKDPNHHPEQPLTVYVYNGGERRGARNKRIPMLQVTVKSPHPDGAGTVAFNRDGLTVEEGSRIARELLAEGHPAGNGSARRLAPPPPASEPDQPEQFARAFAPKKLALDEDGDWYDNETPLEHDPAPSFTVHTKDGQEVPIHGSREDGDHGHDYTFVGHLNGQEIPVASMTVHRKGPTAKFKVQLPREHRKSGIAEAVRHHADQIARTHGASLGKPDREELEDHEDAPIREAEFVEPSRPDARTPPRGYSFAFANERYW